MIVIPNLQFITPQDSAPTKCNEVEWPTLSNTYSSGWPLRLRDSTVDRLTLASFSCLLFYLVSHTALGPGVTASAHPHPHESDILLIIKLLIWMCEADLCPWEMTVSNDSICNILVFSHAEWVQLVNSGVFFRLQSFFFVWNRVVPQQLL